MANTERFSFTVSWMHYSYHMAGRKRLWQPRPPPNGRASSAAVGMRDCANHHEQTEFPSCISNDSQESILQKVLLLRDASLHRRQPHYIWVTGVIPRSFIPLARTKRAAWKRQSLAWKTRTAVSLWYCHQTGSSSWDSSSEESVRGENTVLILCPHAGHRDLHTHIIWVLSNTQMLAELTAAADSPSPYQQKDTWRHRESGKGCPAQSSILRAKWPEETPAKEAAVKMFHAPQAALKTSLFLTMSCLLLSWLFGKGSIDLA